jgi:hypothetical protein
MGRILTFLAGGLQRICALQFLRNIKIGRIDQDCHKCHF